MHIQGECVLFSKYFQQARPFLENNKIRDNKFISPHQTKQVQKLTSASHRQYKSSPTTISKANFGIQLTLLLLHAGLVQRCFLLGGGWGWALIKFLGYQHGHLSKGGRL